MSIYYDAENDALAFAVAALYHNSDLTQDQIKTRLHLKSATQVSRLLQQAQERGFVKPVLEAPPNFQLGADLSQRLQLRRVVVASTHETLEDVHRIQATASVAAQFWKSELRTLPPGARIGIGGGRAVASLVDRILIPPSYHFEFLSIANIPFGDWEVSSDTNVAILKRRFPNTRIRPLGAMKYDPDMTDKQIEQERKRLLGLKTTRRHMQDFKECHFVFSGMGSADDNHTRRLIDAMNLPGRIPKTTTGDMSYNLVYHDQEVFHRDCPMNARLISVEMESLKNIASQDGRWVLVVAWGARKARPVLDAYRAGTFNALAIDVSLANEMVKLINEGYLTLN